MALCLAVVFGGGLMLTVVDTAGGLLPMASVVSEFRVLGLGWHLLWSMVGVVVTALLCGAK